MSPLDLSKPEFSISFVCVPCQAFSNRPSSKIAAPGHFETRLAASQLCYPSVALMSTPDFGIFNRAWTAHKLRVSDRNRTGDLQDHNLAL